MTNKTYLTIRQFAATGILPEHAIRKLVKEKRLPAVFVGTRAMLPHNLCVETLEHMAGENAG